MKKVFLWAMVALFAVSCGKKQTEGVEETIRVVVEKATPTSDCNALPYVGVVEEESSTSVSFTGMAMLKTLTVSEGEPVRKGQLLAVIDETQARNALATAKASLDQALDARERMKLLHDNQSLPEIKWVEVQSQVSQAQSAYDMCKKNLEDCRIYAPVSGVVRRLPSMPCRARPSRAGASRRAYRPTRSPTPTTFASVWPTLGGSCCREWWQG